MVTRRCTQRTFLLRPDEVTNQVFLYCLAYAAQKTGVQVLYAMVMSNHHHAIVHPPRALVIAVPLLGSRWRVACVHPGVA